MLDILTRAGCFVAIILLGYTLRRTGVFGPETFGVLSKVVMKITLPAALIASAAGKPIDASMLTLALLGLGGGLLYILAGWLLRLKGTASEKAFYIQNVPGYNIGTFALPFTQSFLGPVGVLTTSIFDLGNAIICFGASFSIARAVKEGGRADFRRILKTAVSSLPFLTHLTMVLLNLNSLVPQAHSDPGGDPGRRQCLPGHADDRCQHEHFCGHKETGHHCEDPGGPVRYRSHSGGSLLFPAALQP